MPNRNRNIQLNFRVSAQERSWIETKMAESGVCNREAYLRKMAINGYILRLELPELKEMISLLRRLSNNTNQIARSMNETGRIYEADVQEVLQQQEWLWEGMRELLAGLARLR